MLGLVVINMRLPWKRFVAIALLAMLALLRVESIHAGMQGHPRAPGRILRLERLEDSTRLHLIGWAIELPPALDKALREAPSRLWEGVHELIGGAAEGGRTWESPLR